MIFAIPLFGSYLAKEWLWFFTPSLSYVGQGIPQLFYIVQIIFIPFVGIIMGFPTTVSMNLVGLS